MHRDDGVMASLRQWWAQPDQYNWFSEFLASRQLQGFTRTMAGSTAAFFAVVPILMLWSPSGPQGRVGTIGAITMSLLCVTGGIMWLVCWPTQRQSAAFALGGNACVTLGCLIAGSPITGLLACTTFAPLAGYVALFHSSRLLTATLINAGLTTALAAARIAAAGDIALAAGHFVAVAIAVVAVPFAAQVLVHLLTVDALMSHTDPLTGLRNRRGYYRSTVQLIDTAGDSASSCLTVTLVDLDGFKQINDRHGHGFGDAVLIAVADNLRRFSAMNSVVARVGGEEFLIAELAAPSDAAARAERLRQAVASAPGGVTASLGMASMALADIGRGAQQRVIEHLVDEADTAMYEAKRAGGNQTRHRPSPSRLID
ncbi:GGDEF domain-containing protein [Mycobacterium sp. DL592]|uniref:GGDEF domain-containing protein n=1 Tax=Mycobacterium sp. DL592 TaxID=2675524 RepID=UPI001FBA9349|nr:GGDEF domain-containing protein [Mycobacterium sp. DL592]